MVTVLAGTEDGASACHLPLTDLTSFCLLPRTNCEFLGGHESDHASITQESSMWRSPTSAQQLFTGRKPGAVSGL